MTKIKLSVEKKQIKRQRLTDRGRKEERETEREGVWDSRVSIFSCAAVTFTLPPQSTLTLTAQIQQSSTGSQDATPPWNSQVFVAGLHATHADTGKVLIYLLRSTRNDHAIQNATIPPMWHNLTACDISVQIFPFPSNLITKMKKSLH